MERQFEFLLTLIRVGSIIQEKMSRIIRWGRWHHVPGLRPQSVLSHSHQMPLYASIVLEQIEPYGETYDKPLLLVGFSLHDTSEGELERDVSREVKTTADDVAEYNAFIEKTAHGLPGRTSRYWRRAFLLQFALCSPEEIAQFPIDARFILIELSQTHRKEALLFAALERLEYILYAIEHVNVNAELYFEVVSKQVPILNEYADQIPGFREEIWPHELSNWLLQTVSQKA